MHPFEQELLRSWPRCDWQNRSILLAVSGGADSVALLRGLCCLRQEAVGQISVAHFNHGVRGAESNADEQFVIELGRQLGVPVLTGKKLRADNSAAANEEDMRAARYEFLRTTAEKIGARYVVMAHTADDQVETILHRIFRGTGMAGLAGIPRTRPLGDAAVILRPLLQVTRQAVLEYLKATGQEFREDRTNQDVSYTRNRIRHQLLPFLTEQYNPNIRESILRLGQLAAESQQVTDRLIEPLLEIVGLFDSSDRVRVNCAGWKTSDAAIVRAALVAIWRRQSWPLGDMGFREWERLSALAIEEKPPALEMPGAIRAQKEGAWLVLTRLRVSTGENKEP
jgi:tRNA(Ile)-lysidine synthase